DGLRKMRWLGGILAIVGIFALVGVRPALASRGRRYHHRHRRFVRHHVIVAPLYHAEVLEDADSGAVLYAKNPNLRWPPASMAKMMLLLVATDQIRAGRVSLNDPVRVSERAAATGGSRLGIRAGQVYPLRELMKAALIRSANDAAVAVAEKIGGSVEATVRMMNAKARALGMDNTYYGTVEGLPPRPGHDVDYTTPLDLARLARAVIHHTDLLTWSSMQTAEFDGVVMMHNTNRLVGHFEGCDGLKTGFTYKAGFNLTATARRGDMRLISVILGAPSNSERFVQSARLLTWGFDNFKKVQVLRRGQPLPVEVRVQAGRVVQPIAESDISLVIPKAQTAGVTLEYSVPPVIDRPLAYGDPVGQIIVMDGGEVMTRVDAICPVGVGEPPHELGAATTTAGGTIPIAAVPSGQASGAAGIATVPVSENSIQVTK
ncbi:MAG TPA: D-alanyl-D-alanine carboxypeptidase family protein, partial [Candidatus Binataceae bacterium]|nr:D-alanyl-D-alanine carboxypeptidase family protein [Candidatus Binataceae bacterium]